MCLGPEQAQMACLDERNWFYWTVLYQSEERDIKTMAYHVYDILQISFIQLAKPKPIKEFDDQPTLPITYSIIWPCC